jgi:hypothetical protein
VGQRESELPRFLAASFSLGTKRIAIDFAFVFVIGTVITLLLTNMVHTLLNLLTSKRMLVQEAVFPRSPELIACGLGIAALLGLNWVRANRTAGRIPPYLSPGMPELDRDLLHSVMRELSNSITLESGATSRIGLAAILVSYFGLAKPKEAAPPQERT